MENSKIIYALIVTGIEAGNYSSFIVDGDWEKAWRGAEDKLPEAFAHIKISDRYAAEESSAPAAGPARLTDTRLEEAWAKFQTKAPRHYADAINGNDDAITGDVFLQILAFGDIIFG